MNIKWNVVTWHSKLAAVVVFGAALAVGAGLGRQYEGWQRDLDDQARRDAQPPTERTVTSAVPPRYAWFEEGDMIRYVNLDVGVEFTYPKRLDPPVTEFEDHSAGGEDQFQLGPVGGKRYTVRLGGIYFSATTKDYRRFLQDSYTGAELVEKLCTKDKPTDDWPLCGMRTFGTRQALLWVRVDNAECSYGGLMTKVFFRNEASSPYAGLEFIYWPHDASQKAGLMFDCLDDKKAAQFMDDALVQSKNIMSGNNLSHQDIADLRDFSAVIASVRTATSPQLAP